ncbi:hypothetical protein CFP56_043531 [Quercus suber]|uniref:Uncharacterized protein n=1 Tax=Quercus suber TaxID=58331 RepID=A0AAW0LHT5_QUESU
MTIFMSFKVLLCCHHGLPGLKWH